MPWMEANGVALRYELSGEGPETLILVHELGEHWKAGTTSCRRWRRNS